MRQSADVKGYRNQIYMCICIYIYILMKRMRTGVMEKDGECLFVYVWEE